MSEKISVSKSSIDKEVLDIMKQDDVMKVIGDEKLMKRATLDFFCEMLSTVKELNSEMNNLFQIISICSAKKVSEFFTQVDDNFKEEKKRVAAKSKAEKSHEKKKINKKTKA